MRKKEVDERFEKKQRRILVAIDEIERLEDELGKDNQKAMLDFSVKLARTPEAMSEGDYQNLRDHGFSDEDIWDIGAITALFGLSNRMAHLTDMRPNDEFYLMGRVPPAKKS